MSDDSKPEVASIESDSARLTRLVSDQRLGLHPALVLVVPLVPLAIIVLSRGLGGSWALASGVAVPLGLVTFFGWLYADSLWCAHQYQHRVKPQLHQRLTRMGLPRKEWANTLDAAQPTNPLRRLMAQDPDFD